MRDQCAFVNESSLVFSLQRLKPACLIITVNQKKAFHEVRSLEDSDRLLKDINVCFYYLMNS